MMEGVLRHCTEMEVEKNYVDSHGQSVVAFAFSHLLGFQLLPRLKAIHQQRLYRPDVGQPDAYPHLQPILSRPINWDLIIQQYDNMVKYATALRLGTAATEADEFAKIYELDVTVIPTNRPMSRVNFPDVVYKTEREKFEAVSGEIAACHEKGQPVLVGTVSIEKSEHLARLLKKRGIPHQVLNAKYHEREAEIVAQAGREKAVTIATNMAGRGTDILLGGNPDFLAKELLRKKGLDPALAPAADRQVAFEEAQKVTEPEHERVVKLGGLHIIGTERHESRRIDNQLRGRSGRRATPAPRASTSLSKTTSSASSAPSASSASWSASGWKRASLSSTSWSRAPSARPRSAWRPATSRSASICSNTTTS